MSSGELPTLLRVPFVYTLLLLMGSSCWSTDSVEEQYHEIAVAALTASKMAVVAGSDRPNWIYRQASIALANAKRVDESFEVASKIHDSYLRHDTIKRNAATFARDGDVRATERAISRLLSEVHFDEQSFQFSSCSCRDYALMELSRIQATSGMVNQAIDTVERIDGRRIRGSGYSQVAWLARGKVEREQVRAIARRTIDTFDPLEVDSEVIVSKCRALLLTGEDTAILDVLNQLSGTTTEAASIDDARSRVADAAAVLGDCNLAERVVGTIRSADYRESSLFQIALCKLRSNAAGEYAVVRDVLLKSTAYKDDLLDMDVKAAVMDNKWSDAFGLIDRIGDSRGRVRLLLHIASKTRELNGEVRKRAINQVQNECFDVREDEARLDMLVDVARFWFASGEVERAQEAVDNAAKVATTIDFDNSGVFDVNSIVDLASVQSLLPDTNAARSTLWNGWKELQRRRQKGRIDGNAMLRATRLLATAFVKVGALAASKQVAMSLTGEAKAQVFEAIVAAMVETRGTVAVAEWVSTNVEGPYQARCVASAALAAVEMVNRGLK